MIRKFVSLFMALSLILTMTTGFAGAYDSPELMSGSFEFSNISDADYRYMESLFPDAPDFEFTHPSRLDSSATETTTCYRSKYGITWHNARSGQWRNYKFRIIEC